jgi:hypothetical protein
MATVEGAEAIAGLLLVSVTTAPTVGAALLSATIPVEAPPPPRIVGLKVNETAAAVAVTLRTALRVFPPTEAVIVAETLVATALVVAENVADVAPAKTVTVPGTATAALLLVNAMATPPVGAAPLNVTVPAAVLLPTTVLGFMANDVSVAAAAVPVWTLYRYENPSEVCPGIDVPM